MGTDVIGGPPRNPRAVALAHATIMSLRPSEPSSWQQMLLAMLRAGYVASILQWELGASPETWTDWILGERPPREMTRRILIRGFLQAIGDEVLERRE